MSKKKNKSKDKGGSVSAAKKRGRRRLAAAACAVAAVVAVALAAFQPWSVDGNGSEAGDASQAEGQGQASDEEPGLEPEPGSGSGADIAFESEEDAGRYAAGEWHTDKELYSKYGPEECTLSDGTRCVKGELILRFDIAASDEEVEAAAQAVGGAVSEVKDFRSIGVRRAVVYFPGDADLEALMEQAEALPQVVGVEANAIVEAADSGGAGAA